MAAKRTYGDGCAIAQALDLVGDRWALLVVRELLLGPKRHTDLRRALPHASPNVLSQRLTELEGAGVIRRRKLPPPADPAPIRSADSVMLALRARFDPRAAHGLRAVYQLRLGEDRFRIQVADDQLELARGDAHQADATIDTDNDTIAAVLWGGRSLADAQRSGSMTTEGDKATVERFAQLFPMSR